MQREAQHANDAPLLAVRDLRTHIFTRRGVVKAVNGVSFQVRAGETLGLVGESGSGKTMTCLSILRLLPRGARIVSGEIWLQGTNLATVSEATVERVRGKQIGMVLQNALAALDPLRELQQTTGMAIMFVTHDISLVGNMCDQLAVFYGGLLVEYGPRQQVLSQPSHPYTAALLQSIPQLGEPRERLPSIAGEPPDLRRLPAGCPFHPRCDPALDVCRMGEPPPVFTLAQGRQVRCWLREQDDDRSAAGSL